MTKVVAASPRTLAAIKKADALPRILPSRVRKGTLFDDSGSTDTLTGVDFWVTDASDYEAETPEGEDPARSVSVAEGEVVSGSHSQIVAATELEITESCWIVAEIDNTLSVSIVTSVERPVQDQNTYRRRLAYVTLTEEFNMSIRPEFFGGPLEPVNRLVPGTLNDE